jgi:hypothetical protein
VECVSRVSGNLVLGMHTPDPAYHDRGASYSNYGDMTVGWPDDLGTGPVQPPALGDMDLDGSNEIAWATGNGILWKDVNHPPSEWPERMWPMARHDAAGTSCWNCPEPVAVAGPSVASIRVLFAAPRPNPASSSTLLLWELPSDAVVDLAVYDVRGRRLRTLHRSAEPAGPGEFAFDLTDRRGVPLAAGVYYLHLKVAGPDLRQELVRKLVCIR